ncbi:MAG: hypothetical protein ACLR0N_09085 [Bilophila wadsworthia]
MVIEISAGRDDVRERSVCPTSRKKKVLRFVDREEVHPVVQAQPADQASDLERILAQVGKNKKVAFSLLGGLPEIVRKADFEVTAVLVETN